MSRTRSGLAPRCPPRGIVEVWGPLQASWSITFCDSKGATMVGTYDRAAGTVAYFLRTGREPAVVTRTETCPAPGCDGDGMRSIRKRNRMFLAEVPCKCCRGQHDTVEAMPAPLVPGERSLTEVLAALGLEHHAAGDFGAHEVTQGGWPLFRGGASSTWEWLRETGRIL